MKIIYAFCFPESHSQTKKCAECYPTQYLWGQVDPREG